MSSQIKPRYEYFESLKETADDSWFDTVPHHWEVKKISHVVRMQSGDSIESSKIFPEGEYPVFGGNGSRGFTEDYNLSGHYVLVGRQGALCGNINYSKDKVWASEHAVVVYPLVELSVTWLGETLRAMDLNQYNVSAAQPGLSVSNITCLKLPYPPYAEQQKIANFLDHETAKIDTLIEKQQQLIKLLKEKRQAVISHAVTKGLNPDAPMKDSGVEWLGEVPAGWVVCALKHVSKVIDCKHITAEFVDDGIPLASIGEVKSKYVDLTSSKKTTRQYYLELISGGRKPTQGDLIFSRNATVGEVAIVEQIANEFAMGQDVCLIRPFIKVLPAFLYFFLTSTTTTRQLELLMIGSTFKRINVDDIRNFDISIPCANDQSEIVEHITLHSKMLDRQLEKAGFMIGLLKERRTALISAAVTGKIDVRNWQPPESSLTPTKGA